MVDFNIFEPASFFGFALQVLLALTHGREGRMWEPPTFERNEETAVVTFCELVWFF